MNTYENINADTANAYYDAQILEEQKKLEKKIKGAAVGVAIAGGLVIAGAAAGIVALGMSIKNNKDIRAMRG